MATRILEFGGTGLLGSAFPIVPAGQFMTKQAAITATTTSAQSAAVSASTQLVIVQSDEAVYVEFGTNPTATTDSYRLQAGGEQSFSVPFNKAWKVAVRT